ncbi:hypothetical protein BHU16_06920, partial [Tannerella sp. oral taxon 808]
MKKQMMIAGLTLLSALIGACAMKREKQQREADEAFPTPAEPIELKHAEKVATDNAFTFDLLRAVRQHAKGANIFISPLSVSMALNMTLNGAAGATADEMRAALHEAGYTQEDINACTRELREALMKVDPKTTISIANSIWHRKGETLRAPFLEANRTYYGAEVRPLDFASPQAPKQINDWCAQQTNGKIPQIVNQIPADAFLYLINAVYFKGEWAQTFDKDETQKAKFHKANGAMQEVNMMHQQDDFRYGSNDICQLLEMRYGNGAFGMVIMLPRKDKTTRDVVASLSKLWKQTEQLSTEEVNLYLPRFRTECQYDLAESVLPTMGMKAAFTPEADFSGISNKPLRISGVIHKTFVEVNENGTAAAAATSVEAELMSMPIREKEPVLFRVDHPFVFAIRERSTGA